MADQILQKYAKEKNDLDITSSLDEQELTTTD
jgi:hypothetical protein